MNNNGLKRQSSHRTFSQTNLSSSQKILPTPSPSKISQKPPTFLQPSSSRNSLFSNTHKHQHSSTLYQEPSSSSLQRPILLKNQTFHLTKKKKQKSPIIPKFYCKSLSGCFSNNETKINQDSYIAMTTLSHNSYLFAVADGHGPNGHQASSFITTYYPTILNSSPFFASNLPHSFLSSSSKLNDELCSNEDFDTNFSGSTLISILIRNRKLWAANIGDSRAVLARQSTGNSPLFILKSVQLSRDHKPCDDEECLRIISSGGRVDTLKDESGKSIGPHRVWLKNQRLPGLAMSRSLGDKVAASVGVSSEPEILELRLTEDDKFIIIGSDGVFEFLSNEEVVGIVQKHWENGDYQGAVEAVVYKSRETWKIHEDAVDDITCLLIVLQECNN